jgi:hypothetical protein
VSWCPWEKNKKKAYRKTQKAKEVHKAYSQTEAGKLAKKTSP